MNNPHETHICKSCGVEITVPLVSATNDDYWERAIEAGTHRPAVDDFGNRYLAAASATDDGAIFLDRSAVPEALRKALAGAKHMTNGTTVIDSGYWDIVEAAAIAASATDEDEEYAAWRRKWGLRPAVPEALDAMALGRAMDFVDREDEALGVVGRGRKVDRIIEAYAALRSKD